MLSIVGIVLEEMKSEVIPINPTIIRVMRVLRIARGNFLESCCISQVVIMYYYFIIYGFSSSVETVENG